MAHAKINAGACGFSVDVEATTEDGQHVKVEIETDCENFGEFKNIIAEVDAFQEIEPDSADGKILNLWPKYLHCSACPAPAGIIKAVEVAAGLAIAKDAEIKITK